jgi:hypothetical protein
MGRKEGRNSRRKEISVATSARRDVPCAREEQTRNSPLSPILFKGCILLLSPLFPNFKSKRKYKVVVVVTSYSFRWRMIVFVIVSNTEMYIVAIQSIAIDD